MSLKAQAAGVAIGGAVIVLGLWYVKRQASGALSSVGAAITGTASDLWNTAQTPVLDPSLPLSGVGNGIVAAPSNALDSLSFGTIGGSTAPGSSLLDTLKAGPLGAVWGFLSGDAFAPGNSSTAGLDFGTGSNTWND